MSLGGGERDRVARVYARLASRPRQQLRWSAENPGNAAIREELVAAILELAGARLRRAGAILDVGCGTGWWLERLSAEVEIGARLEGLELLPTRASAARLRVPAATITVGDARALPYATNSFQVVSLLTVLSSLPDQDGVRQVLAECTRVLDRGGTLLIWEPRLPTPANRDRLTLSAALFRQALSGMSVTQRRLTLLPPLARRLGPLTPTLYPQLVRVPFLRTHRLIVATQARRVS